MSKLWVFFSTVWTSMLRMIDVRQILRDAWIVAKDFRQERTIAEPGADVSEEDLLGLIRRRLAIALGASELCGTYFAAPVLALALQYAPGGDWHKGTLGGIAGDYFGAVLSFAVVWVLLSIRYYVEGGRIHLHRYPGDMWYLHASALGASLFLYAADYAVAWVAVTLLSLGSREAAENSPVLIWFAFGNGVFEILYLGAAAGFIPEAARRFSARYRNYLERGQVQSVTN